MLDATSTERLSLPSGDTVDIPKAQPVFTPWTRPVEVDTYGRKQVLDVNGRPVFAEIAILMALMEDGWQGVWIDSYRRKFRTYDGTIHSIEVLPDEAAGLLRRIYRQVGKRGGAWDVFCWQEGRVLFAESKRKKRDRIRSSQLMFLEAALKVGLPMQSFLLVEWDLSETSAPGEPRRSGRGPAGYDAPSKDDRALNGTAG